MIIVHRIRQSSEKRKKPQRSAVRQKIAREVRVLAEMIVSDPQHLQAASLAGVLKA